jgi:DNA-binding NtrC family response regulator
MSSKKIKIAIVDDEQDILDMISKYLTREGSFDVYTFANPLNALSSINDTFDVVLLDIMMPQLNGLEVLVKIQEQKLPAKVIMMTAYSTLDKVLKSHREGATHYIMKPFSSLQDLAKKIKEVV